MDMNGNLTFTFEVANVGDEQILREKLTRPDAQGQVRIVTCFSTTMWLHVRLGDDGLRSFFRTVCDHTDFFLVEPQPRKSYRELNHRLRSMGCETINMGELNWLRLGIEQQIEMCILQWSQREQEQQGGCDWKFQRVRFRDKADGDEDLKSEEMDRTKRGRKLMLFKRAEGSTLRN
eukprot:gnl/TRDRNA2_/TRDRNA2_139763_c0_seq1.p1 gnl/TRDRNA2_/TRDRNA2_139763_c0~~gnl/TRDRNA2_/TRDRNA2_139763_c0_seq1.p1  ORF type:complete len:176 (-),score=22.68 gnl/TRDRNA2_/TRDRNA2_139763_c0_seq1:85-612(-)